MDPYQPEQSALGNELSKCRAEEKSHSSYHPWRLLWPGTEAACTRHGSFQQLKESHHKMRAFARPVSKDSRGRRLKHCVKEKRKDKKKI